MSITRVQYRERQRLTAADLRTEQEYRLGIGGRHHLAHHDSGVVRGLRVIPQSGPTWTLMPGVAIDRYGREILVPSPVQFRIDDPRACSFILLYYCDSPEQVPCNRRCEVQPAPRTAQNFRLVVANDFRQTSDAPLRLDRLRAAGPAGDQPPAPVVVARIGVDCGGNTDQAAGAVDYSQTRYVGHRASLLVAPTGRATLQLGLSGHADIYHLLLSTVDADKALKRRVGVDRDGVVHVWQALFISGTAATGQLAIGVSERLNLTTALPAGLGTRVIIRGRMDSSSGELVMSLVDVGLGPSEPIEGRLLEPAAVPALKVPLGLTRMVSFDLDGRAIDTVVLLSGVAGLAQPASPEASHSASLPARFSVELKPSGGALIMCRPAISTSDALVAECGDVARFRSERDGSGGPVVRLKAGPELKNSPVVRELGAVTVLKPSDPVPRSELRISGGDADDSDGTGRVSIGAQLDGAWVSAMTMNGKSGIVLPIGKESKLTVQGTVYLPPIGRDDPVLPDLMAKAYTCGLRQMGRLAAQVTLALSDLPEAIVHGENLRYKVNVTVNGGITVDVKRCLELISGTRSNRAITIRTLRAFPAQIGPSPSPITRTVNYPDFRTRATKVRIEVELLLGIGGRPFVAIAQSGEIEVKDPDGPA